MMRDALYGVACILLLTITVYALFSPNTSWVVIDMKRAIERPATMLAHSQFSKEKQTALMERYGLILPKVIQNYGNRHHVLMLSASVLVSDKKIDITDQIISLTLERLKEHG